ncbi:UNVERIFIED_CONTAM: CRISPR-associated protein Csm6 family [Acetivibrio alkalicellulosi]
MSSFNLVIAGVKILLSSTNPLLMNLQKKMDLKSYQFDKELDSKFLEVFEYEDFKKEAEEIICEINTKYREAEDLSDDFSKNLEEEIYKVLKDGEQVTKDLIIKLYEYTLNDLLKRNNCKIEGGRIVLPDEEKSILKDSPEINSILQFYSNKKTDKNDMITLLYTKSIKGYLAAQIIREVLLKTFDTNLTININSIGEEGQKTNYNKPDQELVNNLKAFFKNIMQSYAKKNYEMNVFVTGGFRVFAIFSSIFASSFCYDNIYFMFEGSEELLCINLGNTDSKATIRNLLSQINESNNS